MTFQGSPETSLHGWFLLQHIKQTVSLSPKELTLFRCFPVLPMGGAQCLHVSVVCPNESLAVSLILNSQGCTQQKHRSLSL